MDILKSLDSMNPFLQPSEKAKVQERMGKNPKQFDMFKKTYPVVTLERRKQEIEEMKEDIDRIKAEVSMSQYRTDMMARKSALDKAEAHRKEQQNAQTLVSVRQGPEENDWEHMMPISLKDHLEAVAAPTPMQLPDSEFDLLTKEVEPDKKVVIWRYVNGELPYWAKELPKYKKGLDTAEDGSSVPSTDKALPGGWVPTQYEGKTLYVNHDLQQTSWYPFPVLPMKAVDKENATSSAAAQSTMQQAAAQYPPDIGFKAAAEDRTAMMEMDMTELENRLASYTHAVNWPHKFYEAPRLSTLAMAECGFYYVFDEKVFDRVRCAFCNVELSSFKISDDPWVMHCMESPNCNFVKDGIPGINPATGQVAVGREAIGRVRFEARHPDELSFQKGDAITVLYDAPDDNWYVAEINGKKGVIPGTHVKFLKEKTQEELPQRVIERMETRMEQFAATSKKDFVCTAIYDYTAKFSDELSFRTGQKMIVLLEPAEPGWYIGSLNGKKGLVPTTHVTVDESKDQAPGFFRKSDGAPVPVVQPKPWNAVDPQPAAQSDKPGLYNSERLTGLYYPRQGEEVEPSDYNRHSGHRPTSFGLSQAPATLEIGESPQGGLKFYPPYGSESMPTSAEYSMPVPASVGTVNNYPQDPFRPPSGQFSPAAVHPNQPGSSAARNSSSLNASDEKTKDDGSEYTLGLVFNAASPLDPVVFEAKQLMDEGWNLQDMPAYAAATISKGDRLLEIDGKDAQGLPLAAVHRLLRGKMNSVVFLLFEGGPNSQYAGKRFQAKLRRHLRHSNNSEWEDADR